MAPDPHTHELPGSARPGIVCISLKEICQFLSKYVTQDGVRLLSLGVLLVAGTILQTTVPLSIRFFVDTAIAQEELLDLYFAAGVFLGGSLLSHVFPSVSRYVGEDLSWRATNRLRSEVTEHVLKADLEFHTTHNPGELLERIDGDVLRLSNFFSAFGVRLLGSFLWTLGILVVLASIHWQMGLAMTLFVALYVTANYSVYRRAGPLWKVESECRADLYGFLEDRLSGCDDIRAIGAVDFVIKSFHSKLGVLYKALIQACTIAAAGAATSNITWFTAYISVLCFGIHLFDRDQITIGSLYLLLHYLQLVRGSLSSAFAEIKDLQGARASISRIKDLLNLSHGATARTGLPLRDFGIRFRDVSFAYHEDSWVLRDISCEIPQGKIVGILGRTGSGKTTLSRLLLRFYEPTKGTILLGDTDIRRFAISDLRGRLGVVTQEVQIFHATVRDNLTLFERTVSDQRVIDSIRSVGLGVWYDRLPAGLETELTGDGRALSAGEAQLLAYARVFIREPDIVILDEATSRLDYSSELLIRRATEKLVYNRTTVVIAHRLATMRWVDYVMILESGRIKEFGERVALLRNSGSHFARLIATTSDKVLFG